MEESMSRVAVVLGIALCMACASGGDDAGSEADGAAAAPAALTLDQLAGTWTVETRPMDADTVLVTSHLVANNTMNGWMLHIPGRDSIPVRIAALEGDSVVMEMGPFPSVLREGQTVTTRNVARLADGAMVGVMTATYAGGGADSVATFRSRGTRH
jgi:hypothetical protein